MKFITGRRFAIGGSIRSDNDSSLGRKLYNTGPGKDVLNRKGICLKEIMSYSALRALAKW